MDKISGLVQAVGTQFNGSVKVNGVYYNFKKGYKAVVQKGDMVSLTLEPWKTSTGKSGVNIVEIDVLAVPSESPKPTQSVIKTEPKVVSTDWAAKDRSQLVGARSHDSAVLTRVCFETGAKPEEVLRVYKQLLVGILDMAEEIK